MTLNFDFSSVKTIEFGVGRDERGDRSFSYVPVDAKVQAVLQEMAEETSRELSEITPDPSKYEPSQKYESKEHIYLPLIDDLSSQLRDLHQANNLPVDSTALSDPTKIFCYFARLTDAKRRRITALRRATQFKGVLKNRLIHLRTDALRLIEDNVFKLDTDFDLLIDSDNIHILRPSSFEFAGQLQEAIMAAAPENIALIQQDLTFVDFSGIQDYAVTHPRAARYLASIRAQKETKNVDMRLLKKLCKSTGVEIQQSKGTISVDDSFIMGFLEVLDRRRYEIELVKDSPERYRAPSREKLKGVV